MHLLLVPSMPLHFALLLPLALLVPAVAGCGGTTSGMSESEPPDTTGEVDAGSDASAAKDGGQLEASPSIDSRQSVTIKVTCTSSAGLYLLTEGNRCTPFQIEKLEGATWKLVPHGEIPRSLDHMCCKSVSCDPPAPHPSYYTFLNSSQAATMVWDAREIIIEPGTLHCYATSPDIHPEHLEPVSAGHYRVTVTYVEDSPSGGTKSTCVQVDGGLDVACGTNGAFGGFGDYERMCQLPLKRTKEFDLPASGDYTVDVEVP